MSMDSERRTSRRLYWSMEGLYGQEITGFQPEGLESKTIDQAASVEEVVFISIREIMENNDAKCMDNEDDRLDLCQQITRWVYRNRRKIT